LEQEIRSWQAARASAVFFESTRRLAQTLKVIARCLPGARVAVGRELTKLHEEIFCGSVEDAAAWADSHAVMRGEATVMVDTRSAVMPAAVSSASGAGVEGGAADAQRALTVRIRKMLGKGATLKDILQALGPDATAVGVGRKELYRMVLDELAARRSLD
jgi:16S rRNA C1402 (ribose-2'-O) methylase RsmI